MREITSSDGKNVEKITSVQERNLRKLAAYLASLPKGYEHFDMASYFHPPYYKESWDSTESDANKTENPSLIRRKDYNECGTVACAAGHGPAAGIRGRAEEGWNVYCGRVFGAAVFIDDGIYNWCFDGNWDRKDNTPHGAAQRIIYMLRHGAVPRNSRKMLHGRAPLIYKNTRVPKLETLA